MKYSKLVNIYEQLSSTSKRLEKIEILSKFLRKIQDADDEVLHLLMGNIYPEHDERKTGISNQLAIKAISKSAGVEDKEVIQEWKSIGDLGKVAEKLRKHSKQSTLHKSILTTKKVLDNLKKLPELEGKGTVGRKISLITELLSSASPVEGLYIIRTLIGDLRIGVKESSIKEALALGFFPEQKKEASKKIQDAIDKSNDVVCVFEIVKKGNLDGLENISLEVGKPIKVMLSQKKKTISDAFKALGKPCAIEYKYDGFRLIIHKKNEKIILFTRRLENVTKQFPEVVDYVKKYVRGNSFIIDTEAVGYDPKTKEYKPFQEISQRIRRKYDIEKLQKELPIEINVFDIIYYNGKSLLNEPFEKRTALIKKIVDNKKYHIVCSKQIITSSEKEAIKFYNKALEDNQEGVMMKSLSAKYQPGSRVGHMLKIKPEDRDYDLVITGAEYGTGKRSNWMSSFILSCRNKNEFLEIGKVGTGIKEKFDDEKIKGVSFHELTEKLKPLITKEEGKSVQIKPKIVVSITYQEIQKSINYNSGFALRFPRVITIREDKPLSEINTLNEIKKDYEKQKRN